MARRKKAKKRRSRQKPSIAALGTGAVRGAAEAIREAERRRKAFLKSL